MIDLPFPPASLSGHNTGHWRSKPVAKYRKWAMIATKAADTPTLRDGDILVTIHFIPPDNRGDRCNFPNRVKPYLDGIADALGVNDKRFVPRYLFAKPRKPGCVQIVVNQPAHDMAWPYSER